MEGVLRIRIANRLRTSVNSRVYDSHGDNNLYNLCGHEVKFPLATLFGGRKHRDKFNFLTCVHFDN